MSKPYSCRMQIATSLAFVLLFATAVFGQTPAPAEPGSVESQIETVKAENAALREQIRKIEEQQREMRELLRLSQPVAPATASQPPASSGSGSAVGSGGTEAVLPPAPPTVAPPAAPAQGLLAK